MLGSNILVDVFFVCIIRVSQFRSILHHDLADLSWSVLGWRMPVSEHCNSLEWRGSNRSGSLRRSYEFLAWKGHSDEIWWDGVKRCPDQLNSGKRIKQMPKKIPPKNSTPLSGPAGVRQNHFFGQPKCLQGYANAGSWFWRGNIL